MLAGCGSDDGPPIDFGTPSTDYPASHAAIPSVRDQGGPVQSAPVLTLVTVAGDPLAAPLADFLTKIGPSSWWDAALGSYGVGPASFGGAVTMPAPTDPITHDSLAAAVDALLDGSHPEVGTPSLESNYVVVLPEGAVIKNPTGGTSCRDFGGYHESLAISAGPFAGTLVTYSIIPRCEPGTFPTQLDELTFVISHEVAETASDPLVTVGQPAWGSFDSTEVAWNLLYGGEIADMCESHPGTVPSGDLGYRVAPIWSNRAAAAGHDPCQPSDGPHFGAAPVLTDVVAVAGFAERARGAIIPVGSSGEIEIDIFSDAPTNGPIQIGAVDAAPGYKRPVNLAFKLDRTTGLNGEKVHLTVHVLSAGTGWGLGNVEIFYVTATQGDRQQLWPVLVGDLAARD